MDVRFVADSKNNQKQSEICSKIICTISPDCWLLGLVFRKSLRIPTDENMLQLIVVFMQYMTPNRRRALNAEEQRGSRCKS